MSQPQDSIPDEASFEGLVDLGSIPPAASEAPAPDVHAARTTVARVSESFLDELKRGRAEATFQNEAPTKPKGLVVVASSTMPPEPELPLGALEVHIEVPELPPAGPVETYPVRSMAPLPPPPAAPVVEERPSLTSLATEWLGSIDLRRAIAVTLAASALAALAVAVLLFWAGRR